MGLFFNLMEASRFYSMLISCLLPLVILSSCRRKGGSHTPTKIRGQEERISKFPREGTLILYGRHWLYQPDANKVWIWQSAQAQHGDISKAAWPSARERLISQNGEWMVQFPSPSRYAGDESHWPWSGLHRDHDAFATWKEMLKQPQEISAVLVPYPSAHGSADGHSLIEAPAGRLLILRTLDHSEPEVLWTAPLEERIFAPRWSPDGKFIAFSVNHEKNNTGSIWIYDRSKRQAALIFTAQAVSGNRSTIHDLSWSPDGQRLVFVSTLGRGCRGGHIGITGEHECFFDLFSIHVDGRDLRSELLARSSSNPIQPPSVCWLR